MFLERCIALGEVLDVHPAGSGGEVVDNDDVMVLCQRIWEVRAGEAGPAGDDVAHEESMLGGGLDALYSDKAHTVLFTHLWDIGINGSAPTTYNTHTPP